MNSWLRMNWQILLTLSGLGHSQRNSTGQPTVAWLFAVENPTVPTAELVRRLNKITRSTFYEIAGGLPTFTSNWANLSHDFPTKAG